MQKKIRSNIYEAAIDSDGDQAITVAQLKEALSLLPDNAPVMGVYDGCLRLSIAYVYMSKSGIVALCGKDENLCYDRDRPIGAPDEEADKYFSIPDQPNSKPRN